MKKTSLILCLIVSNFGCSNGSSNDAVKSGNSVNSEPDKYVKPLPTRPWTPEERKYKIVPLAELTIAHFADALTWDDFASEIDPYFPGTAHVPLKFKISEYLHAAQTRLIIGAVPVNLDPANKDLIDLRSNVFQIEESTLTPIFPFGPPDLPKAAVDYQMEFTQVFKNLLTDNNIAFQASAYPIFARSISLTALAAIAELKDLPLVKLLPHVQHLQGAALEALGLKVATLLSEAEKIIGRQGALDDNTGAGEGVSHVRKTLDDFFWLSFDGATGEAVIRVREDLMFNENIASAAIEILFNKLRGTTALMTFLINANEGSPEGFYYQPGNRSIYFTRELIKKIRSSINT